MRHFASVRVVRLSPLAAVLQQQTRVTLETITTRGNTCALVQCRPMHLHYTYLANNPPAASACAW